MEGRCGTLGSPPGLLPAQGLALQGRVDDRVHTPGRGLRARDGVFRVQLLEELHIITLCNRFVAVESY